MLYAAVAAVIVVGVATGVLYAGLKDIIPDPIPASGGEPLTISSVGSVPYYLQTDPAWAGLELGGSDEKMANAGCTVCCLAMGLSALGHPVDPGELCRELGALDGFTDAGQVIWRAVADVTGGEIAVALPELTHDTIDAELAERRPVMAKIMLSESVPHWVLIVGKDGREYRIMDPLDPGKAVSHLSKRSKAIEAIRVFTLE